MLESTKEDATGLPEGSDIGLGAGGREFESRHSDQKSRMLSHSGFLLILRRPRAPIVSVRKAKGSLYRAPFPRE